MKRDEFDYFNAKWRNDPKAVDFLEQKAAGKITRSQYKAGIDLVKQDVLKMMVRAGRITEKELANLTTLRTLRPHEPRVTPHPRKRKRKSATKKRKRVSETISKILPTHGKTHKLTTPWKYTSEFPGGLPGLGKR
jgi:hypothetical protein